MNPGSDRWRRLIFHLAVPCLVLASLPLVGCGPAPSAKIDPARNRLPLDAWVSVLSKDKAEVQSCVRVAAPHRSLIFRRSGESFRSGLEVRVIAWRDGVQVGGGVGEARVTVGDVETTRGETPLEVTVPLVVRGGEPVTLEVAVRVVESSRSWIRELTFSPHALSSLPLWIAAVQAWPAAGPGGDHVVDATVDSLRLHVTLQRRADSDDLPGDGLSLVSEATGETQGDLVLMRQPIPGDLAPGETRIMTMVWATGQLPFGRCRLQTLVELARDTQWIRLPHEPPLDVVCLRVPLADDDSWRRHVDWLDGVLEESRRDSLREIPVTDRRGAWDAVWRDVGNAAGESPFQAERRHLRRIVSADDRFGTYGRGARSDRGRTLIRWGEPSRTESYADARAAGAVWEVWEYPDRDHRLFFFDAHGTGDFRLRRKEPLIP